MTYGSLLLDLFVVFFLLNRRTRVFGYIAALIFHVLNSRLFTIGVFPWLMIAATVVFFAPDWPRRVWQDFREDHSYRVPALILGFVLGFLIGGLLPGYFSWVQALVAGLGVAVAAYHLDEPFRPPQQAKSEQTENKARVRQREARGIASQGSPVAPRWTLALLSLWGAVQLLMPLRHFFIPGNVNWTEEGHNFSWHMLTRDKAAEGAFLATDPATGEQWNINLREYLTPRQQREMLKRPHMIVHFAHYLADRLRSMGRNHIEIRARVSVSLNGRTPQLLIDPNVDLAKVSYPWWGHAEWILPLKE
jgi:hypothetical protein